MFEIGGFIGGANYIGDVGSTTYINPNSLVAGGLVKWNRSDRHSFRFSLLYADIQANDASSNQVRRQQRGYSFSNHVAEASLGLEFNFWSFDLSEAEEQSTPYLYTGITYFNSKHHLLDRDRPAKGILEPQGDNWEFSIPMVFGYKQTITRRIIAAVEVGARYTFTDNMDGSNPQEVLGRRNPPREFGNTNTTDWYVFSGVSLTFTFGRKPCYSHF
ncbi:DUF6089 family protein [Antarcticibacterium sp. 1MA-6-2]|uniref:type IX secretion system protein PorG n=1 Tax=Antarcticibacterium sp. 1MA-6-2 TaxID=2908210 RepID=UPI001F3A868E|nr:DUF6089 family protein [Antarcticibacterium sp. 1MA-6-2]UJH90886.1 DUF6089 family protein [Antarcticibacterium sp. 1MA-6-2]